tara:strand:- start:10092 stop:10325 length:234 start_codon:yes stop_codon:yes gene_type:complete
LGFSPIGLLYIYTVLYKQTARGFEMEKRIEQLLNQGLAHSEVRWAIYKEYAALNLREADRFEIASMVREIANTLENK